MLHVVTAVIEHPDGTIAQQSREFGGFKRDYHALTNWLLDLHVELVVMESTDIYWKSIYAHLERAGIQAWVVNAHFVKHVPGRKRDMNDSQWLAVLARFGLVRASFIPPQDLRELRLVFRYRRKLSAMRASEINRLHKILDDGGIKLRGVVSDINGLSARAMVTGLIEGKSIPALLDMARGWLKVRREDLQAALDGDPSARHRFILEHIHWHIEILERSLAQIDAYILAAMAPYQWAHRLLQTIPGIDQIVSALILIEIGDDMTRFGNADRIAAWAALCPANNESVGKRKSGRIGKGGSVIRYIMCECANSAWKTKSSLASKYKSLMVRKTHKKGHHRLGSQNDTADLPPLDTQNCVSRPAD
ncbi:transposase [Paraburkholderia youngii]